MNKKILSVSILTFSVLISAAIIGFAAVQAQQDPFDSIQYPVKELGNCQSKQACGTYCDKPANMDACLAFAEKNNLMSGEELAQAKKFKEIGMVGPGGCTGKDSCDKYCSNQDNIEECITFAQKNGLMSGKELEESQKVLAAIKKGVKPPPCGGKNECDAYCSLPENTETCMTFAFEAGLMPPEEQANAQKMLAAIKQGIKPPACRGEEECRNYCSQDEHIEECVKFGEATGMMSKEDATMMRKTGGKGPGGCKSKQECETFCNVPENQETCFNFAKDNGMISPEELQKMEQGKQQMKEAFNNMPSEVNQCLSSALGSDFVEKIKNGTAMPSQDVGEKMRTCFENFKPEPQQGMNQQGEGGQPGQGPDNFGPQQNQMQKQTGPGGCQSPQECETYCSNNPQECQNFGQQQGENFKQPDFQQQPGTEGGFNQPPQGEGQPGQFGPMPQQGQQGQFVQEQPGQMMPQQSGQPGEFQPKELNQMMPLQNQQPGQFIQNSQGLSPEMMPAGTAPGVVPGAAPQNQPGEYQQPMMQQQPTDQQLQPEPQPQPEPEPAPTTMNSNNLFGLILKPFAKVFGL